MRSLSFLIFAAALILVSTAEDSATDGTEILKAKTKFGYFNATFTWGAEQFQLFNFGSYHGKISLQSPVLRAIDYSDNKKLYNATITIIPSFSYHDLLHSFEISTSFDPEPNQKTVYFTINNNNTYEGTQIPKSYLPSILDDIEITVKAVFSKNIITNDMTPSLSPSLPYDDEPLPLGSELLKMFKSDSDASFTIECGGEEITAYKQVMKARSPVFKEQLLNDTDRLRITDFEPKIVRKMVEFCHNDSIEDFENEETSIFSVAYKFKIQSLMSYASRKIAENATIENAVARFKFAHFYGYEKLKKWYFKYIIENFSQITKTSSFKTLDDELYKPILEELIKQNKIAK